MEPILPFLLSYLLLYKYAALFLIVFSSAMILPLPVTELMLGIGAFVGQGYFNFAASLAVAQAANVLGDLADYAITRKYGYGVIHKFRLNRSRFFTKLEQEINVHVRSTIFLTRFAGGLGPAVNFLSGAIKVPVVKFLIYDFAGNFVYFTAVLLGGYLAGNYWENFSELMSIFVSILVVVMIMTTLFRVYKRMKRNRLNPEASR